MTATGGIVDVQDIALGIGPEHTVRGPVDRELRDPQNFLVFFALGNVLDNPCDHALAAAAVVSAFFGSLGLQVHNTFRPIRQVQRMIQRPRQPVLQRLLQQCFHRCTFAARNQRQVMIETERADAFTQAQNPRPFFRKLQLAACGVQQPVPQPGDTLGRSQPRLAAVQIIERPAGPQDIADTVAENQPVQGFGEKVGGADIIGFGNGINIIKACYDQNGHLAPAAQCPDGGAGVKPVKAWHHHIEQHQIRAMLFEEINGIVAIFGFDDGESGLLQSLAHQNARHHVIFGNQDNRLAQGKAAHAASPARMARSSWAALVYSFFRVLKTSAFSGIWFFSIRADRVASRFAPRFALEDFILWAILRTASPSCCCSAAWMFCSDSDMSRQ